jgi:pilus assembly protein Flp/PilA
MQNFKQLVNNLISDESGQDLIEYALVASLVALGAVASMNKIASSINSAFTNISTSLTTAI